ncbi:radical SAM protein [Candidatus Sumerlaeota bacterium]|nr:radical SAM protein [Candidatus Sumerlaeota bacterium]
MRILFLLPEATGWLGTVHHGKAGIARLSLTTLASLTPPHHEIVYRDSRVHEIDFDMDVDLVCITALTNEAPHAYFLADEFRRRGVTVIMGGVHVSACPDEALEHCDAIVIHEAEGIWEGILDDVERGELKRTYKNSTYVSLNGLPNPRRDLLDHRMYSCPNSLIATRGCPFKCNYCTVTSFFGNTFRVRPPDEVLAELHSMRPGRVFFMDDNLIGNLAYAKELLEVLRGCGRRWGSQASINLAQDQKLLEAYHAAGGDWVFIGFETLSEANLRASKKTFNLKGEYEDAIKRIHDAGISIYGSFIFGFDDDEPGVFADTLEFIMKNRIDMAMYHILTPYPGTELRDIMLEEGRVIDFDWIHYNNCEVVIQPRRMTVEQLQEGYHWMHRQTYSMRGICRRVLGRSPLTLPERFFANLVGRRKAKAYPEPSIPFHEFGGDRGRSTLQRIDKSAPPAEPMPGEPIPLTEQAAEDLEEMRL